MNIFTDPSLWRDLNFDSPPIWWNAETEQYEILIDESGSPAGAFSIVSLNAASAGDTLSFDFSLTGFDPQTGGEGFLNVIQDNTVVFSQSLNDGMPVTGSVNLVCEEGSFYKVMVTASAGGYDYTNFYDFMATLTPADAPVPTVAPWWLCPPKEPVEPCPVRPTGFVPFDQYDADFKYPLASSRVPSKVVLAEDCISCSPASTTNIDPPAPEPEPPAECGNILLNNEALISEEDITEFSPSAFQWGLTNAIALNTGVETHIFTWDSGSNSYMKSSDTSSIPCAESFTDWTVSFDGGSAICTSLFNQCA